MTSEKLRLIFIFLVLVFLSHQSISSEQDKHLDKIKEYQALIDYEKKSIKGLLVELKEIDESSRKFVRLEKLIKVKHTDLKEKKEKLNALIKAVSYGSTKVSEENVQKIQTISEIEDEIGIDRNISSIHKKVKSVYKDFRATEDNKSWQKKQNEFFRKKEQEKKIIMVE